MKKIILNADDFGVNLPRSLGILQAAERGILTSTTALVAFDAFEESWKILRKRKPDLCLGIHLQSSGRCKPLLEVHRTLTDEHGFFLGKHEMRKALFEAKIDLEELRREFRAQIQRFIALTGQTPSHADGHHHIHIYPGVTDIALSVCAEFGIRKIRVPLEVLPSESDVGKERLMQLALYRHLALSFSQQAKAKDFVVPDHFAGLNAGDCLDGEKLGDLLKNVKEGVTEIMTHPGFSDKSAGGFSNEDRERELKALCNPALHDLLEEKGIQRISHREL